MSEALLERRFDVRPHESDICGTLRPVVLLAYLQNVASEHATILGVSVRSLQSAGLTWVMSRMHLRLERYPRRGDSIIVRSWPVNREGLFSVRDFEVLDGAGAPLGAATSSWAVLDLKSRRPVRIEERLPNYPLRPLRALEDSFATLPVLEDSEAGIRMPVLRADLDMNCHVNNTVYAGWGLEAAPARVADNCRPMEIEIGFRAEAHYGDAIVSLCGVDREDSSCLLHRIENAASGLELARLRTRWKPA